MEDISRGEVISRIHILYFIPASRLLSIPLYHNRQLYSRKLCEKLYRPGSFYKDRIESGTVPRIPLDASLPVEPRAAS